MIFTVRSGDSVTSDVADPTIYFYRRNSGVWKGVGSADSIRIGSVVNVDYNGSVSEGCFLQYSWIAVKPQIGFKI